MSLHDSDAYIIEASTAAESLPDAAGLTGRTYRLHNNSNANQVWSVAAGLGYTIGGANSATITLGPGQSIEVVSNGTRWVGSGGPARQLYAATGVSDASGNVTFTFPTPFPVAPVAAFATQFPAGQNPIDVRWTSVTTTSATCNVRQSPALIILSLSVLGLSAPLAGVTIHAIFTTPGATP